MQTVSSLAQLQSRIYQEARAARPIPQLTTWLLDRRTLDGAWERVQSSNGANTPGVDHVTADAVREQIDVWIPRLASDLLNGRYMPGKVRWIEIPKPNKSGESRSIGILTIRDRMVHTAIKLVLEPILDPVFVSSSYGFRPGRSVPGALADATQQLTGSDAGPIFSHVVHLDVKKCFDTLDHKHLLESLHGHVADAHFLRLIQQILRAGGQEERGWLRNRWHGLIQGSALSPLLCNLALHPLDVAMTRLGQQHQDGLRMLRYADDLLLLGRSARLVEIGIQTIKTVLEQMHQRLGDIPAVESALAGVSWLGVRIQPRRDAWAERLAYGYVVPDQKVRDMHQRIRELTVPPSERLDPGVFNLNRWIVSLNDQLRDWRNAYVFADNAGAVFAAIDNLTRERVGDLLHTVTGLRRSVLVDQYQHRLPRGFWTWEVQGARLVILSSLAPKAPNFLTRRPAWMRRDAASPPPRTNKPSA